MCYSGSTMDYLEELNPAQRQAVLATEGPLLVLAGAGAGKTKTITHRILHLIKQGTAPGNILAVTFTNKAAGEMRERVAALIQKDRDLSLSQNVSLPFVSTFHSLGVRILKENARAIGLTSRFTIYDRGDSLRTIKDALVEGGLDPKQIEPKKILSAISREKGKGVNVRRYTEQLSNDYFPRIVARVWERYEAALLKEKSLDFDDLLLKTADLLKRDADVRHHYRSLWRYIHVDEYQDTNSVQYDISRILAGEEKKICVVGDIDQNIYSWRGADLSHVLNFEKHYPGAKVILLEENYRSTKTIVSASNEIIKKNKARVEKNLYTNNEDGEKISLLTAYDESDEADKVAQHAGELIKEGTAPKEIAVLYRANFQSRALEEAFLSHDIPYQVLGVRFFERKEIKDMLSFLKAALNPEGLADLKRILNVPPRGIGKVTLVKMAEGKEDTLPAAMKKKVAEFRSFLQEVGDLAVKEQPSVVLTYILKHSGLEAHLKAGSDEELERLENIRELVTLAKKYDTYEAGEGVEKFLEDAALRADQDELEEESNSVKLMTVHAAKGLEFNYVFVTGMEEGLFPHERISQEGDVDTEEERRLFYVALTRARKKVFLTFASVRTIFGSKQVNIPSEFITDLEEEEFIEEDSSPKGTTIYLD